MQIKENFYGIPAPIVVEYVRNCANCAQRQKIDTKPPLRPIICNTYRGRVQIDLIDMQKYAFDGYKWVLTEKDHFSRFVQLFALKTKTGKEVIEQVRILTQELCVICRLVNPILLRTFKMCLVADEALLLLT